MNRRNRKKAAPYLRAVSIPKKKTAEQRAIERVEQSIAAVQAAEAFVSEADQHAARRTDASPARELLAARDEIDALRAALRALGFDQEAIQ